eukprot:CAMPEP_0194062724 /NCGR_PEP_ID=MMETSP0009_2-20130614/78332_1 /TAXON_ID=210454 /ORGANISM="Grammatophora oceanica, Strain CCMP 410" /LENGTH=611 /DNA_ID=CAMNT_0038714569 /DNA_START=84 /DNA_END=1919 /DNA_ORIENTATION=+
MRRHMCCALLLCVPSALAQASTSYDLREPCTTGREGGCLHEQVGKRKGGESLRIKEKAAVPTTLSLITQKQGRRLEDAVPTASPSSEWPIFLEHLLSDSPSETPTKAPTDSPTTASPALQGRENEGPTEDCDGSTPDRICDHKSDVEEKSATTAPTKSPSVDLSGKENAGPESFLDDCVDGNPDDCPHDDGGPEETDTTLEPTTTRNPTASPSASPTSSAPVVPGGTPSPSITSALGIELVPCEVDGDGVFGIDRGEATTFEYVYEVEMNGLVPAGVLGDIIEGSLDDGFGEVTASSMFPEQCSGAATASARSPREGEVRLLRRRRLAVTGVSARPVDTVLEDQSCSDTPSPGNNCYVVVGRGTIYAADGENVDEQTQQAKEAIRLALNDGAFDNVDNRIVAVTHRASLEETEVGGDGSLEPTSEGNSNGSNNVPAYIWAIIAGAVVALLAGVFFVYQRSQTGEKQGMSPSSGVNEYPSGGEQQGKSSPQAHYYNEGTYQGFDSGNEYDPSMGENTKDAFAYSSGESGQNYEGAVRMHGGAEIGRGAVRSSQSSSTPSTGSRGGSAPQFREPSDFQPDGSTYPQNRAYHEPEIPIEGDHEDGSPVAAVQVA